MKYFICIILISSFSISYADEKQAWPISCSSAVEQLLSKLSSGNKAKLRNQPWNKLIIFHHGLGTYIRNNFGLWQRNNSLISSCTQGDSHPDRISQIIIKKAWLKLNLELHCKNIKANDCNWHKKHKNEIRSKQLRDKKEARETLKKLKYLGFFKGSLDEEVPKNALKAFIDYSNFLNDHKIKIDLP